jgi:hypothetical protein
MSENRFFVWPSNDGYPASLALRKPETLLARIQPLESAHE